MISKHHTTYADGLGARLARGWRSYVRAEKATRAYLRSRGANDAFATLGVWAVRALAVGGVVCALSVLHAGLHYLLSAAIVVVVVIAAVRILGSGRVEIRAPKAPEWQTDSQGTGVYQRGTRIDPYDPNDPTDSF